MPLVKSVNSDLNKIANNLLIKIESNIPNTESFDFLTLFIEESIDCS